jgi:hypothetical protein
LPTTPASAPFDAQLAPRRLFERQAVDLIPAFALR